jgi:DNA-binding LacI/PurR family transcriptional regulator
VSISDETRQRVLAVVEELNYQPHPFARALRGKGTNLLGLIVREIDDPFFAQIIEVISDEAKAHGFDLVLAYAKSDPEEALTLSEVLDLRHSDGLLLLGDLAEATEDRDFLARMSQSHHMVSLCRGSEGLVEDTAWVGVDNRRGVELAMEYLSELGHRRIAMITTDRLGDVRERTLTYLASMKDEIGGPPQGYVERVVNSYRGGYEATRRFLALPQPPTAILAVDDTMAVGALAGAHDAGRRVPQGLSVIGFDDVKISAYLRPALTTVRQPVERIGRKAVELLVDLIRDDESEGELPGVLVSPELVVRDSCAPPAI